MGELVPEINSGFTADKTQQLDPQYSRQFIYARRVNLCYTTNGLLMSEIHDTRRDYSLNIHMKARKVGA